MVRTRTSECLAKALHHLLRVDALDEALPSAQTLAFPKTPGVLVVPSYQPKREGTLEILQTHLDSLGNLEPQAPAPCNCADNTALGTTDLVYELTWGASRYLFPAERPDILGLLGLEGSEITGLRNSKTRPWYTYQLCSLIVIATLGKLGR